jgi:uncharacterized protein
MCLFYPHFSKLIFFIWRNVVFLHTFLQIKAFAMQLDEPLLIGRIKEKEVLNALLSEGEPVFLALYGRRRVGKTHLIRSFYSEQIAFDFSGAREGSKQAQIRNFYKRLLFYATESSDISIPESWSDAFHLLAAYLEKLSRDRKHVVFLDEMPWMDTPRSEFIPALEFFWNQHISRMPHIILIGCGSATSWIRKNLLYARGGLYNRVTHRMKLRPFNLHDTEQYLMARGVELPRYQILELYMAMGGIPYYLNSAVRGKSATQIIEDVCFDAEGFLVNEYEYLYYSLFKNADNHIALIEMLGARPQGVPRTDLKNESGLAEATLSRTLDELEECDFITRFYPINQKKKQAVYKLTDLYSLFYIKFIRPNKNEVASTWEQLRQQSAYISWSGYAFENICMQHVDQIKTSLGIRGVFTTHSSWRYKGDDDAAAAQIDMIIDRADQVMHLCEAKFTKENYQMTREEAARLRLRKSTFKYATGTKKAVFTLLLTTYPAMRNLHYKDMIEHEVTMEDLFVP